eukprot:CAMPEP_0201491772 /NCGR_PEP_ID=MMETSP0151_2-20130828/31147_1 /ASSEMBLY_ACC=CAM_ASM_000257 /TAXON_ID=200890 /ORGANISM="Paramoeba atlantica, Strain 621/1 / CCAP 1560/9" /LENGTH=401 /DNA_ID=CAMNT_0047878287 /DNA_START=114 /DNA_END=1319 /DNA_ORIENTATION=-
MVCWERFLVLCCLMVLVVSQQQPQRLSSARQQQRLHFQEQQQQQIENEEGINEEEEAIVKEAVTLPSFECPPQACDGISSDVNHLRFCDIGLVAAMGDSITAAFGANSSTILRIDKEWRGVSFSIGGDGSAGDGDLTLPNMIKVSNSSVQGWSVGVGNENSDNSRLNVAVSGAVASDMPGQAVILADRFKMIPGWDRKWKLVSIFIGGNDLCDVCHDPEDHDSQAYSRYIEQTLDYLLAELPMTLVNLILPIDVTSLGGIGGAKCSLLHPFECSCAVAVLDKNKEYTSNQSKFMAAEGMKLSELPKYQQETFGVVAQPFMVGAVTPTSENGEPDLDFFALDCFHFSLLGHQAASIALWNNMNQAVGRKSIDWDASKDNSFVCPSQNDYICTNGNIEFCSGQ